MAKVLTSPNKSFRNSTCVLLPCGMLPSVRKAEAEAEAKAEAEAAAKAKAEAEVVATDKAGETPGDICKVITRQLYIPYKTPLHTAYGEVKGACTMLIEVHTTQTIGYGECVFQDVSLGGRAMKAVVDTAASWLPGKYTVFESRRFTKEAYKRMFQLNGTCSAPRFGAAVLSGLEMAMWDAGALRWRCGTRVP